MSHDMLKVIDRQVLEQYVGKMMLATFQDPWNTAELVLHDAATHEGWKELTNYGVNQTAPVAECSIRGVFLKGDK